MRNFDDLEYQSLRNELNVHIDMAYKQSFTIISIVLVYYAAIFAFYKDIYNLIINTNVLSGSILSWTIMLICGLPTILIFPFSVKYHDNIRSIICIATYCKIFYEFPTMLKTETPVKAWELIHCNSMIPYGRMFASIHYIISWAGTILCGVFGAHIILSIINMYGFFNNFAIIILDLLIYIGVIVVLFYFKHQCHKNVNFQHLCSLYEEKFSEVYIEEAVNCFGLTPEQKNQFFELRKSIYRRDYNLIMELKKREHKRHFKKR